MEKILALITAIRESHPDMEYLYTQGQCYNFYKILKSVFPEAECWYAQIEGHVYSKIGDSWYDIRGRYEIVTEDCQPMDEIGLADLPENWGPRDTRRLVDTVQGVPGCILPPHLLGSKSQWQIGFDPANGSDCSPEGSFSRATPTALGGEMKPYLPDFAASRAAALKLMYEPSPGLTEEQLTAEFKQMRFQATQKIESRGERYNGKPPVLTAEFLDEVFEYLQLLSKSWQVCRLEVPDDEGLEVVRALLELKQVAVDFSDFLNMMDDEFVPSSPNRKMMFLVTSYGDDRYDAYLSGGLWCMFKKTVGEDHYVLDRREDLPTISDTLEQLVSKFK